MSIAQIIRDSAGAAHFIGPDPCGEATFRAEVSYVYTHPRNGCTTGSVTSAAMRTIERAEQAAAELITELRAEGAELDLTTTGWAVLQALPVVEWTIIVYHPEGDGAQ